MARYIGPVCRQCRREGMKLYLKGERCHTEKCAIEKRNFFPGQHGKDRKRAHAVQAREITGCCGVGCPRHWPNTRGDPACEATARPFLRHSQRTFRSGRRFNTHHVPILTVLVTAR